ncbi:hypothetical protein Tco_0677887 [Tanacetum coccineum]|uniref:Uncharacterized protein n=1 Tax=Tanacetum coccineum TaxID=301880 RepID=A0ABQ4XED5_9ASTR
MLPGDPVIGGEGVDLSESWSPAIPFSLEDLHPRNDEIRYSDPLNDEEPMAEVQLTVECNIFAIGQQHTEQPEIIIEGRVDQFSPNKTSAVSEKTSPRSDLRWKPTGRNSKTDWSKVIPTDSYSTLHKQVDINPHMVSKVDIPNIHACKQTLDEKSQIMFRKEDISETIVKVDSQMMIQRNDV